MRHQVVGVEAFRRLPMLMDAVIFPYDIGTWRQTDERVRAVVARDGVRLVGIAYVVPIEVDVDADAAAAALARVLNLVGIGVVKHHAVDLVRTVGVREIDVRGARRSHAGDGYTGVHRGCAQGVRHDLANGIVAPGQVRERVRAELVDGGREEEIGRRDRARFAEIECAVVVRIKVDRDAGETVLTGLMIKKTGG